LILGDNLGLHSMLGFSESFMANFPCRFCKSSKFDCNYSVICDSAKSRNEENYLQDLATNNLSLTGINEECVWNQINGFHAVHNYSVDLMHDILEGVCSRHLGVMIGDLVPRDSEYWQLYILLRKIIEIVTLKSIQPSYALILTTLISEHHQLYLKLFNTNLKPKHHHLLHYPDIMKKVGPLSHLWSMRYESKHRESKLTAHSITSRKNICLTLALKHQLKFAYRLLSKSSILSSSINIGKEISLSEVVIENIQLDISGPTIDFNSVRFVSWVENDIPFLIGQCFKTLQFDEHFQAYEVKSCNDLMCISFNDLLVEHSPCVLNTISNECAYKSCTF
ncbi:uncharacterized protein LOC111028505, partial [Myzus persicae]|uniref:uncharacterized protein LOC111028505 n=1 Tax=Myzus persicae TaxID=13164 RepID=UPI000B93730A